MDFEGLRPVPISRWPQEGLLKELLDLADFEAPFRRYHHAILDVFPHKLTEEEVAAEIQDFPSFNLKYEPRYLAFLQELWESDKEVWVEWNLPSAEVNDLWRCLLGLDVAERRLFLQALRQSAPQPSHYKIESAEVLRMIGQGCTRELGFATFFFPKKAFACMANFDLSWPIYVSEPSHIPQIQLLANQHQLYLRDLSPPLSDK